MSVTHDIQLPPQTPVVYGDSTYTALAILDIETKDDDFVNGKVLVINRWGEMLTLPVADCAFKTLTPPKGA